MSKDVVQYHKKYSIFTIKKKKKKRVLTNQMLITLTKFISMSLSPKNYKENKKNKGYKSRNHLLLKGW